MKRRYFALLTIPVAFYAYACSSSDPEPTPADTTDSGTTPTPDSGGTDPIPEEDGSTEPEKDGGKTDSGADAGPPPECKVDPFKLDGGAPPLRTITDFGVASTDYLDGPQWVTTGGGMLYFSNYDDGTLQRVAPDGGTAEVVRTFLPVGHKPIGNAVAANGHIVTAVSPLGGARGYFAFTAPDGGTTANADAGAAFSPNDIAVAAKGYYFTDPGYQFGSNTNAIYFQEPGKAPVVARGGFNGTRPNGVALSPDQKFLFVSFTVTQVIEKYPVKADGTLDTAVGKDGKAGTFLDLSANADLHPDGIAVDYGGNLYIATAPDTFPPTSGSIEIYKANGTKFASVPMADRAPTSLAFGGADGKTLYITTSSRLVHAMRFDCAGAP